jgi:la-related protein 1
MAAATGKPEMPTFSYAQAAKGISTASTTSLPSKPASIDQSKGVRYDETNNSSHQPSANVSALPVETEVGSDPESSEISGDPETQSPNGETQQPVTVTNSSMQETSGTSSPIDGTASTSTLPKDDDISAVNGISDAAWDGQSQASGPNERTSLSEDGKKDSSSNTVSERSFGPRELKAAPIPVVNIWQQRKEAQEAKAKATAAALKSVASNNLSPKTTPGKPPNGVSHPPADNNDGLKTAGKKKPVEPPSDGAASQGKDRKRADTGKGKDESELSWTVLLFHGPSI